MAWHCAAYTASLGSVTNSDTAALSDGIMVIQNNHFLPQRNMLLHYAAGSGPNTDRIRISSPTNRQITLPFIRPFNGAALPATDPNVADYRANPFLIEGMEELAVETSTNAVGPSRITVLVGIGDPLEPAPRGNVFTMRGTSTTAAVANAWTQIAVTWADSLPQGDYLCVGASCQSTNQLASRLTFENQYWRPGGQGITALGNRGHYMFDKGGLGVWGRFRSVRMPNVEVLANAADAVHEIYMDLIRVS